MYNKIKQKNQLHRAQGARVEVSMSSFENDTKTILRASGKAQLVQLFQPVCQSFWFVSVYSGPFIMTDRQGTGFGLYIPPGL